MIKPVKYGRVCVFDHEITTKAVSVHQIRTDCAHCADTDTSQTVYNSSPIKSAKENFQAPACVG